MAENFKQPTKRCPKCGQVIPDNQQNSKHKALLVCEACAIASAPPVPRVQKRSKLKEAQDDRQAKIDAPSNYIV
jgi:DNA-directed RNA polymerase subunit M/transcription elongation factor TFIIS